MDEENFAQNIRNAGRLLQAAEQYIAETEAIEKRITAQAMVRGEANACKTNAAQIRYADLDEDVFAARVAKGVAKGSLAAAKSEFRACEIEFEKWRSDSASRRLERKAYNA